VSLFAPRVVSAANTLSVAQLNLWNFFDPVDNPATYDTVVPVGDYMARLSKLALVITTTLKSPNIISLNEIENERVLNDILNLPTLRAQGYKGVMRPSNDSRGINVAVMYCGPLEVTGVDTPNPKESFKTDPAKGQIDPSLLYARPPLVVDFKLTGIGQALDGVKNLTVAINHFKSKLGGDGPEPRRQRQGEYLGEYIDKRQTADPNREYIVVGDLNAFYTDGAYKKLAYRKDGTERLTDVLNTLPDADRYTYIHRGQKNLLDHLMTTGKLRLSSVHIPHIDTVRGASRFRLDSTRPEGISDHDPILAVFQLS
jgi:predicted extracellular nuclease